jgi:hypothetical protein
MLIQMNFSSARGLKNKLFFDAFRGAESPSRRGAFCHPQHHGTALRV